ncbi:PilZ domain-containing protein [Hyphomonas sp.]|uniref:PilZ domain-containing protein n=1 Tax=Hyphomonas sp. TaxID=87 RepID=UPI00391B391A
MSDPAEAPCEAPRAHRRQRVLKSARIIFNRGLSSYNATLRDISDGGAKLRLEAAMPVPRAFELLILNPNTGKPERHFCERRWQRGDLVGAEFVPAPPEAEDAPTARCSLFVPGVISGMGDNPASRRR